MKNNIYHFSKGRIALYAILKAMGISDGDEVLLQGFTCVAVPLPILHLGAVPVYVDIEQGGFNMDLDAIPRHITGKTKVIIAQHTYGIPLNMSRLTELARKYNIRVVEDCCHSLSSVYDGKKIGEWGDAAFYSYEWGKPVIIGTGGSAVINDPSLKIRMDKMYPSFKAPPALQEIRTLIEYYFHSILHRPSFFWSIRILYRLLSRAGITLGTFQRDEIRGKMTHPDRRMGGIQSKRLIKKLKLVEKYRDFRMETAEKYRRGLSSAGIALREPRPMEEVCWLRYPLLVKNKNRILEAASKRKIELGNWFVSPVHPLREDTWPVVSYIKGSCPNGEKAAREIITLPIYDKVTDKVIDRTINFLSEMNKNGNI